MRHYEVIFLVHPDQSDQVPSMMERYSAGVKKSGGTVHRLEDCGRRQLAYPINKIHKAHYVLMNVECNKEALLEITGAFQFNDAVIRHMVVTRKEAITEPSILLKDQQEEKERGVKREAKSKVEQQPEVVKTAEVQEKPEVESTE